MSASGASASPYRPSPACSTLEYVTSASNSRPSWSPSPPPPPIDAPCTECLRHGDPIQASKGLTAAAAAIVIRSAVRHRCPAGASVGGGAVIVGGGGALHAAVRRRRRWGGERAVAEGVQPRVLAAGHVVLHRSDVARAVVEHDRLQPATHARPSHTGAGDDNGMNSIRTG
jgi:hypothetical protein